MSLDVFIKYHGLNELNFRMYIESIGFKHNGWDYYHYKKYSISLYTSHYIFSNNSECIYNIKLDDLTPLEKVFKKELRSIKLKELLR